MFIKNSFEKDLFEGMQEAELSMQEQESSQQERLILEAMIELNAAAKKFKEAGLTSRAKEVTKLMISVAGSK